MSVWRWLTNRYGEPANQRKVVQAYHDAFLEGQRAAVINDLAAFCHAHETTHVPGDSDMSNVLEGRRQTFIHISAMLNINPAEIKAKETDDDDGRDAERPADA